MKILNRLIITIIFFSLFTSCAEEELNQRDYPTLYTLEITDITNSGAIFNAEIRYRGEFKILQYGFIWSQRDIMTLNTPNIIKYTDDTREMEFNYEITTGLNVNTTYLVRAYIVTEDYTVFGNVMEFRTGF